MNARQKRRHAGGFSIIETLIAVAVVGLILTLIGLEFVGVVDDTLHTRANTDAESQARLIMARVSTRMRTSFYDVTDNIPGPLPVVSPVATSAPYVTFYRVRPGGLQGPIPLCTPGNAHSGGEPCPPFELVTIQMNPIKPGELDEIITPQPGGTAGLPNILGRNVTSFTVTAQSSTQYNVEVRVSIPSSHCSGPARTCTFTLDNVVYIGGLTSN
jgi:type II secretory pathway pseudopilin PulG